MNKDNPIAVLSKSFALRTVKLEKYLREESSETEYWLELLHESGYIDDNSFESIYNDNCKISATLINIIRKAKESEE